MTHWLKALFGLSDADRISYFQWRLQNPWPTGVGFILAALIIGLVIWSYARKMGQSRRASVVLGALRMLMLLAILAIVLQPELVVEYTGRTTSRILTVLDESRSMSIDDPAEEEQQKEAVKTLLGDSPSETRPTRMQVARAALVDPNRGIVNQLTDEHRLSLFTFADKAQLVDRPDGDALEPVAPEGRSTALGTALDEAIGQYAGEAVGGVVLLSDFAWNQGQDPVSVADRLGRRSIPIFPIPIGRVDPPDVAVETVHLKQTVFVGEQVSLRAQVRASRHFAGTAAEVVVHLDEQEAARRTLTLEQGAQICELAFQAPSEADRHQVRVELLPLDREASQDNNRRTRPLEVIDEKIKVLYVEGQPRWEYRYLRWVLLRDPRLDVRFLMTRGDPDLPRHSPHYVGAFPAQGREEFDFDLIILGDVPAGYFQSDQLGWMREQVQRRGGAMLMIAGPVYAPQTYQDTPVEEILPVRVEGPVWRRIPDRVRPMPTEAGLANRIADIGDAPNQTPQLWSQLAPLYDLPPVSAKPGASVLLTVPVKTENDQLFPLVAWQRFGSGKTMFVGTEYLWRLRRKVGRKYHERFWSTTVQFLTLSRLLGDNERVTLETDDATYAVGQPVQIFADVLDAFLEPVRQERYTVTVQAETAGHPPIRVALSPVPGIAGFYRGSFVPRTADEYRIEAPAEERAVANTARFTVRDLSLEMLDPAMHPEVAEQIAEASGGQVVPLSKLDQLKSIIRSAQPTYIREATVRLWDNPLLYVLLMVLAGAEWWIRRRRRLV